MEWVQKPLNADHLQQFCFNFIMTTASMSITHTSFPSTLFGTYYRIYIQIYSLNTRWKLPLPTSLLALEINHHTYCHHVLNGSARLGTQHDQPHSQASCLACHCIILVQVELQLLIDVCTQMPHTCGAYTQLDAWQGKNYLRQQ